ncbi:lytic transglycosylase domain-containing protein [Paracoccus aerodenitrificans]|uniref:lytic transglycosylase domain-containing protein n=1 Tax=Paracoccus aerodenitrificans TaxID=3017781 RepID=UPI0022F119CE|nr:lytic transglycosylase domain-containing protein [Paracoccus aerodenitrificans]WBU63690.1 lytic transglycosylase domain-containing protein [Paracoccus aerodenitrificans]
MYDFRTLIGAAALSVLPVLPAPAESIPDMATALTAAGARNWQAADEAAGKSGDLAQALVDWHALRAGEGDFAEYLAFAQAHPDWPGMELLYQRGEAKMSSSLPPGQVIDWFSGHAPVTAGGAMIYLAALRQEQPDRVRDEARRIWLSMRMSTAEETAFLAASGEDVSDLADDRVFALLDQFEWQAAAQGVSRMSAAARPLAEARIATQARRQGVDDLILALPEDRRNDPGLAMDRFLWRVEAGLPELARELMQQQSVSAEALRRPEIWAGARADYARASLRAGDWDAAEKIAAPHFLEPGTEEFADLEFLAGYSALKAGAPDRASDRFRRLSQESSSVISQSRALYWLGRAEEEAGNAEASQQAFSRAAQMQTAYYGQLAAERIGAATDPSLSVPGRAEAALPQWRRDDLRENDVFQAGVFAFASGHPELGQRFFLHLSETAGAEDIARMARLTLEMQYPWYALRLAKRAAGKGSVYPAAYFPLTGLEKEPLDLPPELIMAISRQESEFNHTVSSHAGALGLMQLMPGTAQEMARQAGLPYDRARLTQDPGYNATLGAAYLKGLRDRFGPSSALVAAGYNAGPGRSRQWTERFGDIRTDTDPVDWVEMIPFDETRNYVMRVTEALPVYRSRISGLPVALTPSKDLTGDGYVPPPPKPRQTLAEVLTRSAPPPQPGDPLSAGAEAFVEPEGPAAPEPIRPVARPERG